MIARCIHNSGAVFDKPGARGPYTSNLVWDVTPGAEYPLLGMGIWDGALGVLLWDDTDSPFWHPVGLFEIPLQPLPAHWEFARYQGPVEETHGWESCWGYPELARNLQHNVDIQEREAEALKICREEFERRRQEIRH